MSGRNIKLSIIGTQLIVLFILVLTLFLRNRANTDIAVDVSDLKSESANMFYDEQGWHIDFNAVEVCQEEVKLIYNPGVTLKPGTYTGVISYNSSVIQKGIIDIENGVVDTADYFLLSNNKNQVTYDFSLHTSTKELKLWLKDVEEGDFSLTGFAIHRNTNDVKRLILIWLIISVVADFLLANESLRKDRIVLVSIIGIAVLASLPLFSEGIMLGNDIRFHLARIGGIVTGLRSGQFPVKMYPIFNDDYGYPIGVFYGDVLLYIPAVFRLFGFTILQSYKLYIFIINLATATISYVCGKQIFKNKNTALIFSFAFTLSTYRLICIYARAAVGEYSATCFYPIIILAMWNIYTQDIEDKKYKDNALILAIGMTGLVYTHILSAEMVILVLIVLALALFEKTFRKQTIIVYVKSIVICLLLSLAFIIPFIDYYTGVDTMLDDAAFQSTYIQSHGAYISDYVAFFKSILGGTYSNRRGILTPGLLLMSGLFAGIYLLMVKKADKKIKIVAIGSVLCLFVASNIFPWNFIYRIPKIGQFLVSVQFPYRYIGMACCFLALLLGLCVDEISENHIDKKKLYVTTTIAGVLMTCLFVSQYQDEKYALSVFESCDTADLYKYTRDEDYGMYIGFEYLLSGTAVDKVALNYDLYGENSQSAILGENGTKLQVFVNTIEGGTVEVPRFAYPYFVARDQLGNELSTGVGFNNRIKLLFNEPYNGVVNIYFEEPWHWRFAEIISLITLIGIITIYVKQFLSKSK